MLKDLRSENDNLLEWRKRRKKITEELLKKAINELHNLKAKINQKNVCEMMERIATAEEREYKATITPSAISKNKIFRHIIFEENEKFKDKDKKNVEYKLDGDKQYEIFKLKTIIAKQEAKIQELEAIIKRANIQVNKNSYINQINNIDYKNILKDLVNFSIVEGVAYLDKNANLIDETTGEILIASNIIHTLRSDILNG